MIDWFKMWLDNRFPRKPLAMIGLWPLLTLEQRKKVLTAHDKEQKDG